MTVPPPPDQQPPPSDQPPPQQPPPPGQPPQPPPGQPQQPPPQQPPVPPSGGSYALGFLGGLVLWVLPSLITGGLGSNVSGVEGASGILWIVLMVGVLVLAAWLVARPSTRRTGAGIFIALGAIPLIAAGVCVALLAALSGA